jgi:hypothetical protein
MPMRGLALPPVMAQGMRGGKFGAYGKTPKRHRHQFTLEIKSFSPKKGGRACSARAAFNINTAYRVLFEKVEFNSSVLFAAE